MSHFISVIFEQAFVDNFNDLEEIICARWRLYILFFIANVIASILA